MKIDDQRVVARADGALRIRQPAVAGVLDMTLAADEYGVARGFDDAGFLGAEDIDEAVRGHVGGNFHAAEFEKCGREVRQRYEVIHDAPAFRSAPADREADARSEVVEVALSVGKTGRTVVTADDDDGVIELADGGELLKKDAKRRIQGHRFAEVIGEVFADLGHVGEKGREFAF